MRCVVREVSDRLTQSVERYLLRDPIWNVYALYDLQRGLGRFYVCAEGDAIGGLLLDYVDSRGTHHVWLWGHAEAVEELLGRVSMPDKAVFQVPPELAPVVRRRFPVLEYPVLVMAVNRGKERLHVKHEARRLGPRDIPQLAELRGMGMDVAEAMLKAGRWYGVFDGDALAAVACACAEAAGVRALGGFYTRPEYRNRGMATSLASVLVREAFAEGIYAVTLGVGEGNIPARRVYEKVGFRPHGVRLWLDWKTGLRP